MVKLQANITYCKKHFKTSGVIKIDSFNAWCKYISHFKIKRNDRNYIELRPILDMLHLKTLIYDILDQSLLFVTNKRMLDLTISHNFGKLTLENQK